MPEANGRNGVLSRTVITIIGSVSAAAIVGAFAFAVATGIANTRTEGAVNAVNRSVETMEAAVRDLRQQLIRQEDQFDERMLRLEDRVRELERAR